MSLVPDIQVFGMCLGYQKRLWWQLSSILEQAPWEGHQVPRIQYIASVSERDPWFSWNEKLVKVFRDQHGLDLVLDVWSRDNLRYGERGHIRTRNLQNATAKHIQWVDVDMLYPRQFFAKQQVKLDEHHGDHRVMALGRRSMSFEDGYRIIDSVEYEAPIQDAHAKASQPYPTWLAAGGRISGAGFHQCVELQAVKDFATSQKWPLEYVPDSYGRDNNIVARGDARHETRSDRQARVRLGGVIPLSGKDDAVLTGQLHLNHFRRGDPLWRPDLQH